MITILILYAFARLVADRMIASSILAAYIDPNTGGMLFQILAVTFGVISGLFLFFSGRIKGAFYKIKRRISGSEPGDESKDQGDQPAEDQD